MLLTIRSEDPLVIILAVSVVTAMELTLIIFWEFLQVFLEIFILISSKTCLEIIAAILLWKFIQQYLKKKYPEDCLEISSFENSSACHSRRNYCRNNPSTEVILLHYGTRETFPEGLINEYSWRFSRSETLPQKKNPKVTLLEAHSPSISEEIF